MSYPSLPTWGTMEAKRPRSVCATPSRARSLFPTRQLTRSLLADSRKQATCQSCSPNPTDRGKHAPSACRSAFGRRLARPYATGGAIRIGLTVMSLHMASWQFPPPIHPAWHACGSDNRFRGEGEVIWPSGNRRNLWLDAVYDQSLVCAIFAEDRYWAAEGLGILSGRSAGPARPVAPFRDLQTLRGKHLGLQGLR